MDTSFDHVLTEAAHFGIIAAITIIAIGPYWAAFRFFSRPPAPAQLRERSMAFGLALTAVFTFGVILDVSGIYVSATTLLVCGAGVLAYLHRARRA
jgi:hypothetical protein